MTKFLAKKILFLVLILSLFSCARKKESIDSDDRQTGVAFREAKDSIVKNREKLSKQNFSSKDLIPQLSDLEIKAPEPISDQDFLNSKQTISFSVTDEIELKDVLIELGRVAKIDVDLDPEISGGIIISANNRPVGEIIKRICKLGNLRYSYKNDVLHFERDLPYPKNYHVDYLMEGNNLWNEVQMNINSIVNGGPMMMGMGGMGMMGGMGGMGGMGANPQMMGQQGMAGGMGANPQMMGGMGANPQMMGQQRMMGGMGVNPQMMGQQGMAGGMGMMGGMGGMGMMGMMSVSANMTAGILTVFANSRQHEDIEQYLKEVEKSASKQVLIEAKLVEVSLNEDYRTGIDWGFFGQNKTSTNQLDINSNYSSISGITDPLQFIFDGDIDMTIKALERFGVTRTLSSPRIHAINNSKAVLDFTNKLVYFEIENNAVTSASGGDTAIVTETTNSTKVEEDVGVELTITPSVNVKTNEVTLNIQPKITVKSGDVRDPASPEGFDNVVPQIQVREIDTIAKIQSGNVIVIGGLMEESANNEDIGVPFFQRIPILGNVFKSISRGSEITETVIFIKATIVDSSSQVDDVDRDIQEKFDSNRRQFF